MMPNYIVRTIAEIPVDDPLLAVEIYKAQLENTPIDEMVFRVEDTDTEQMLYVYKDTVYEVIDELIDFTEQEAREETLRAIMGARSASRGSEETDPEE